MKKSFKILLCASVALGCLQVGALGMEIDPADDVKSYIKAYIKTKDISDRVFGRIKILYGDLGIEFKEDPKTEKGVIKGFIVGTSDLNRLCDKCNLPELTIYAHYLLIDANVEQHGVNVAFLATNWFVIEEKKIDLSGVPGAEHISPKAPSGEGHCLRVAKKKGKSGAPGLPGESGGHFYGYGEAFDNLEALTIDISGGKGGKGQDGGDGGKGKAGVMGDKDKVTLKYRRHATEYGAGEKLLKGCFTWGNQKYEEIYQSGKLEDKVEMLGKVERTGFQVR